MRRSTRASLAPLLFGCIAALLAACGGGPADPPPPQPGSPTTGGDEKLVAVDAGTLAGHFVARLAAAETPATGEAVVWAFASTRASAGENGAPVVAAATSLSTSAGDGASAVTSPMLQEAGVEEDDVVRSSDGAVYALTPPHAFGTDSQSVLVHRAVPGGATTAPVATVTLDGNVRYTGLYVDTPRRQLLAIGGARYAEALALPSAGGATSAIGDPRPSREMSTVSFIDVPQVGQPVRRTTLSFDGEIQASRVADGRLWLVLRNRPGFEGFDWRGGSAASQSNRSWLARFSLSQVLPGWRVDGRPQGTVVAGSECYLQPATPGGVAVVTSIVSIDLDAPAVAPLARCIAAPVDAVYMTPRALYLATMRYPVRVAVTPPVAGGTPAALSFVPTTPSTDLHKFALGAARIDYRGSGTVPGRLSSGADTARFMLSAAADDLRVLTQLDPDAEDGPARLTVLRDEGHGALRTLSRLPNARRPERIGKTGEQVHAVRFVGDRAYVVTFRRTDPVYAIDLSDPADPRLLGSLEVPGFSDRLYPLTADLLLGVGHDAQSWNGADFTTGVLVSLIDVRDPARPRELDRRLIGARGSLSASDFSPHGTAIAHVDGRIRIALPVSVHEGVALDPWPGAPAAIGVRSFSRLAAHRFEIDPAMPTLVEREPLVAPDAAGVDGVPRRRDAGAQAFDRSIHVGGETWLWYDGRLVGAAW